MWGKQNHWCAKLKCYFSAIFSLFGAFSTHIHIEGLSNVPAFIHFIFTSCATHSNLQIMPLFLVLSNNQKGPHQCVLMQSLMMGELFIFLSSIITLFQRRIHPRIPLLSRVFLRGEGRLDQQEEFSVQRDCR